MSTQRLFGILILAVVALAGMARESWGAELVVGRDYYSVQLLSGTSAAVLQDTLARVRDQPDARIEKHGAEYALRVGYWENREEAVQAAKALLERFQGAHTRVAPYQPEAIVGSAREQSTIGSVPPPTTGTRAPRAATRETTLQAGARPQAVRESAKLVAERVEAERRAEAAAQARLAAESRALRESATRQQAEAQAEAAARERARVAAEREAKTQAELRKRAEAEERRLAESRRDAERRAAAQLQAERESARLAAERDEAERRAEAAAKERIEAEALALREAAVRQQAEAQAEAAARERLAAEREATEQAVLREKAEVEALRLAESRRDAERRAAAAALERSAADERVAREAAARAQAQREAERAAQEKSAEQQRLIEQAQARERAEAEALRLAESRRDAERRSTAEVSPLRTEPAQSQAQMPDMPRGSQLVVGQDYHSVQLLSGTSAAVLQESLARVADQPYARIDKRGAAYALRVGYWDSRAEAVQAAKALLRKFRGAHARIATYRPDAIVAWVKEQSPEVAPPITLPPEKALASVAGAAEPPAKAVEPLPSTLAVPLPSVASALEQPFKAFAPVPSTPAVPPPRTEPAQAQAPAASREPQPNRPEPGRQAEYQLGAGDSIRVIVFQNVDLTIEARVTENGTISFPLIGEVRIGGLTVPAAEKTIAAALKDGGFIQQPQVNIVLLQIRGYQVAVLGQVNRPGRFPLDTLNVRVSEMIAIAGGITVATGADVAVLTGVREGNPYRKEIDIAGMFADKDRLQDDVVVASGDVIFVQRAPLFYIYGEVQRPGSYRVERNMTVQQALAQGGGPTARGTERWLRLHRRGAAGKVEILRPGMNDPLLPEDVIYVRESLF